MAQMENHKYCVYLTEYKGDKLPQFYIGSSSIEKVQNGYNGSVSSKKYGKIYKQEQKENKHLFETLILRSCINRKFALKAENYIQKQYNVVKSELFMNQSFASVNGFFGMNKKGKNNPNYGKFHSEETKEKISKGRLGKTHTEKVKSKMSNDRKGKGNNMYAKHHSDETKMIMSKKKKGKPSSFLGKHHSDEAKMIMSEKKKGKKHPMWGKKKKTLTCPHCGKEGGVNVIPRWHFENCKTIKEVING